MGQLAEDNTLRKVVVAISAFKSDDQIMALLGRIFADHAQDFAAVIVVDSLSDGRLKLAIAKSGWPVIYDNSDRNLGSAGNLHRRLGLAAAMDADWCFTINHDGMFDRDLIARLAREGSCVERAGAVYPARIWLDRGGTSPQPHRSIFTAPKHGTLVADTGGISEVAWDSSNGALYALQPVREGVRGWTELWYGWEDLVYGWQLSQANWKQYRCSDAIYLDDYEYQAAKLLGRSFFIARKPPWTAYYNIRNLMLIVHRTKGGVKGWLFFINRLVREVGFTLLFRQQKTSRLRMIGRGLIDGVLGRTGMRRL